MSKILKRSGIVLLVIGVFVIGLYKSDKIFNYFSSEDGLGFGIVIDKTCNTLDLTTYDILDKSCYHPFCCEPVMVYLFYFFLISPISFLLFYKKQKLPAILFTAFGIGIIIGTFVFFLVMP